MSVRCISIVHIANKLIKMHKLRRYMSFDHDDASVFYTPPQDTVTGLHVHGFPSRISCVQLQCRPSMSAAERMIVDNARFLPFGDDGINIVESYVSSVPKYIKQSVARCLSPSQDAPATVPTAYPDWPFQCEPPYGADVAIDRFAVCIDEDGYVSRPDEPGTIQLCFWAKRGTFPRCQWHYAPFVVARCRDTRVVRADMPVVCELLPIPSTIVSVLSVFDLKWAVDEALTFTDANGRLYSTNHFTM